MSAVMGRPAMRRHIRLAEIAPLYLTMRQAHPLVPARKVVEWLLSDSGEDFLQFICKHRWVEGPPDRGDEGPMRCIHCNADGDA